MQAPREKTLFYLRATWLDNNNSSTLESLVVHANKKLATVEEKTVLRDDMFLRLAALRRRPRGGVVIHIVTETPGESASIVSHLEVKGSELAVSTVSPPRDAEFMDSDAFLFVKDNDVCIC